MKAIGYQQSLPCDDPDSLVDATLPEPVPGPYDLLVAVKVAVGGDDDLATVARAIDSAEAAIRAAVPSAKYIFIEPDLDRSATGSA